MAEAKKQEISVKTEEVTAWDEELSGKKRLFVLFYCTEDECFLNGTRAYLKAYKNCQSENAAAVNAGKLLRNAKVKQAIKKLLRLARDEDDEQAVYRMIKQFEQLSFYNPADIIDASGALRVKDLKELGTLALCVEQIETRVRPEVDLQAMMPVVMLTGKNSEFEKEEK